LQKNGCPVTYPYALEGFRPEFPNRLLFSPTNPLLVKVVRAWKAFMLKRVWTAAWAERVLKHFNVSVVAVDSHAPREWELEGRIVLAAERLRIGTVSLPHGPNVYLSLNPDDRGSDRPIRPVQVYREGDENFESFKIFDAIVAATSLEAHLWRKQNFPGVERIVKLGSARFCPEWMAVNESIAAVFRPAKGTSGKLKVVFFMPHWGESVDRPATLAAIERLTALPNVYLVVKEHTREGAGNLPEDGRKKYALQDNTEVIQSARSVKTGTWIRSGFRAGTAIREVDSASLARWADLTIGFGSSVGLEPLCRGKLFIDPLYLYRHATMYQAMGVGLQVGSEEELVETVRDLSPGDTRVPYATGKLDRLIIYGDREPHDVLATYVDLLESLSRGKGIPRRAGAVSR
ncbi:MAG TPA: hypothetical protein VL404_03600, partial [Candidatus Eisenbacteria bacterium]|nr:hypothetical protein [Candidatus Eisenbacteria bacterium]